MKIIIGALGCILMTMLTLALLPEISHANLWKQDEETNVNYCTPGTLAVRNTHTFQILLKTPSVPKSIKARQQKPDMKK